MWFPCKVKLRLDRADRTYRGGEQVGTTLVVDALREARSEAITYIQFWRTRGHGERDTKEVHRHTVTHRAALLPGQSVELPYSFTAPADPLTYDGSLLSIEHWVRAEIEVVEGNSTRTLHAEERYRLEPGARPPTVDERRNAGPPGATRCDEASRTESRIALGCILFLLLLNRAVGGDLWLDLLLLAPAGYLCVEIIRVHLVDRALTRRLADFELAALSGGIMAPGETFAVALRFRVLRALHGYGITLTIHADESAMPTNSSEGPSTASVHREVHRVHTGRLFGAGERVTERLEVALPDTTAYSLKTEHNSVAWHALLEIDVRTLPVLRWRFDFVVVPRAFIRPP